MVRPVSFVSPLDAEERLRRRIQCDGSLLNPGIFPGLVLLDAIFRRRYIYVDRIKRYGWTGKSGSGRRAQFPKLRLFREFPVNALYRGCGRVCRPRATDWDIMT